MSTSHKLDNGLVTLEGITIKTKMTECVSANVLGVEVGTTGIKGGDTGHGGRTYMKLQDLSSTDMRVRVNNGEWVNLMSEGPLEIAFGGDAELETFIQALMFAVEELRGQRRYR